MAPSQSRLTGSASSSQGSGSSSVRGRKPCKWCKLGRDSPNPYSRGHPGAFLPFAREDGEECRPCVNYIRIVCRDKSKQALLDRLQDVNTGPKQLTVFLNGRNRYIVLFNERGRVTAADLGILEIIQISDKQGVEMQENLGIFWPEKIYNDKKGKKIPPGAAVIVTHGTRKLRGIVLEPSEGEAIGTIRLTRFHTVEVADIKNVANSTTEELGGEKLADVFKACVGKNEVKVNRKEIDGVQCATLSTGAPRKSGKEQQGEDDSDGDIDMTVAAFAPIVIATKEKEPKEPKGAAKSSASKGDIGDAGDADDEVQECDGEPTPKKKRRGGGGGGGGGGISNSGRKHVKKTANQVNAEKKLKEVKKTNSVLFDAEQIFQQLVSSRSFKALGVKNIATLIADIVKRMGPDIVEWYFMEIDTSDSAELEDDTDEQSLVTSLTSPDLGVDVMAKLGTYKTKLEAAKEALACVNAGVKEPDLLSARSLEMAVVEADLVSLKLPVQVRCTLLMRAVGEYVDDRDWPKVRMALSPELPEEERAVIIGGIWCLPVDVRPQQQRTVASRQFWTVLRSITVQAQQTKNDNKDKEKDKDKEKEQQAAAEAEWKSHMIGYSDAVLGAMPILDKTLTTDFQALKILADPLAHNETSTHAVTTAITTDSTNVMHRAMQAFPQFAASVRAASMHATKLKQDKSALSKFALMIVEAKFEFPDPASNLEEAKFRMQLSKVQAFRDKVVNVAMGCTSVFLSEQANNPKSHWVEIIQCLDAAWNGFNTFFAARCAKELLTVRLVADGRADPDEFIRLGGVLDGLEEFVASAVKLNVDSIYSMNPKHLKQPAGTPCADRQVFLQSLRSGLEILARKTFTVQALQSIEFKSLASLVSEIDDNLISLYFGTHQEIKPWCHALVTCISEAIATGMMNELLSSLAGSNADQALKFVSGFGGNVQQSDLNQDALQEVVGGLETNKHLAEAGQLPHVLFMDYGAFLHDFHTDSGINFQFKCTVDSLDVPMEFGYVCCGFDLALLLRCLLAVYTMSATLPTKSGAEVMQLLTQDSQSTTADLHNLRKQVASCRSKLEMFSKPLGTNPSEQLAQPSTLSAATGEQPPTAKRRRLIKSPPDSEKREKIAASVANAPEPASVANAPEPASAAPAAAIAASNPADSIAVAAPAAPGNQPQVVAHRPDVLRYAEPFCTMCQNLHDAVAEACSDKLHSHYKSAMDELVTCSEDPANDPFPVITQKEMNGEIGKPLLALVKLQVTLQLVKAWQQAIVTIEPTCLAVLINLFGDGEGRRMWNAWVADYQEPMKTVRNKYATLTCCQACFRKLKGQETRQTIVASARDAARTMHATLPDKLNLYMDQLLATAAGAAAYPGPSPQGGQPASSSAVPPVGA